MNTISVQDLLNGTQVLAVFLGSLLSIFAFFHFALVKPIRTFLTNEIVTHLVDINASIQNNTTKLDDHIKNGGHTRHGS